MKDENVNRQKSRLKKLSYKLPCHALIISGYNPLFLQFKYYKIDFTSESRESGILNCIFNRKKQFMQIVIKDLTL